MGRQTTTRGKRLGQGDYSGGIGDWDKAIILAELDARDGDEDEQISFFDNAEDEDFVVIRNLSLPAALRKDAIEDAKCQQRMRSRREFTPVAGQPDECSQAQLCNFLRSSRLNQKIVGMVKDNLGEDQLEGVAMASDASRRIIFTKDNNATSRGQHDWKRLKKKSETLIEKAGATKCID